MSDNTEQTNISLVFTDQDQNYYLIPAEIIERGRVPAERKAEVEEAMREHEVTGYNPVLLGFAIGFTATAVGAVAGAAAATVVIGTAAAVAAASSNSESETAKPK